MTVTLYHSAMTTRDKPWSTSRLSLRISSGKNSSSESTTISVPVITHTLHSALDTNVRVDTKATNCIVSHRSKWKENRVLQCSNQHFACVRTNPWSSCGCDPHSCNNNMAWVNITRKVGLLYFVVICKPDWPVEGIVLHSQIVAREVAGWVSQVVELVPQDALGARRCRDDLDSKRQRHLRHKRWSICFVGRRLDPHEYLISK